MAGLTVRWAITTNSGERAHALEDLHVHSPSLPSILDQHTPLPTRWLRIDGLPLPLIQQLQELYRTHTGGISHILPSSLSDLPTLLLEGSKNRLDLLCQQLTEMPDFATLCAVLEPWWQRQSQPLRAWNFKNRALSFLAQSPHIMGIVNVTPDSFSDGGEFLTWHAAVAHGLKLIEEGAQILDIGGESTRPGAEPVSVQEECDRVLPVIEALAKEQIPLSIDTTKAAVAEAALKAGAQIVNDISMLRFEPELASVVAKHHAFLILMHSRHTPKEMQNNPHYDSLWGEILAELNASVERAIEAGVPRSNLAVDPGIGFGKRLQDNFRILRELPVMQGFQLPIVVGASRKSFIGKVMHQYTSPANRLEGSLAAAAIAASHGAQILRVHDVAATKKLLLVLDAVWRPPTS